jgi:hypothetical protein
MLTDRDVPGEGFNEAAERAYRRRLEAMEKDIGPTERHLRRVEDEQRQREREDDGSA